MGLSVSNALFLSDFCFLGSGFLKKLESCLEGTISFGDCFFGDCFVFTYESQQEQSMIKSKVKVSDFAPFMGIIV